MIAAPTFRTIYLKKKRNILDLFSVEGEGGYLNLDYTFMFKGSAFFSSEIETSVETQCSNPALFKQVTTGGLTYSYLDNILRIVLGNNNKCIMYRDGNVDINKTRTGSPYLASIAYNVRDIFAPSTYNSAPACYKQLLLLDNGDLIEFNAYTFSNKILLTDVDQFLSKNQAHRSDCIVGLKDKTLAYINTNVATTHVNAIAGITTDELLFTTNGDAKATYVFCKKNDTQNLYNFTSDGSQYINNVNNTPIASMALGAGEYYLDGVGTETFSLFITNKQTRVRCLSGDIHSTPDWYSISTAGWDEPTVAYINRKIITPTAYSAIIEDTNGKYYFLNGRSTYTNGYANNANYDLKKPTSYDFFDTLKTYLEPIRAKIS